MEWFRFLNVGELRRGIAWRTRAHKRACDWNFMNRVLGERHTHGVPDAVRQQAPNADCAFDPSVLAVARFRDTEVNGVVPIWPELIQPGYQQPVSGDHHLRVARLHREHKCMVV